MMDCQLETKAHSNWWERNKHEEIENLQSIITTITCSWHEVC